MDGKSATAPPTYSLLLRPIMLLSSKRGAGGILATSPSQQTFSTSLHGPVPRATQSVISKGPSGDGPSAFKPMAAVVEHDDVMQQEKGSTQVGAHTIAPTSSTPPLSSSSSTATVNSIKETREQQEQLELAQKAQLAALQQQQQARLQELQQQQQQQRQREKVRQQWQHQRRDPSFQLARARHAVKQRERRRSSSNSSPEMHLSAPLRKEQLRMTYQNIRRGRRASRNSRMMMANRQGSSPSSDSESDNGSNGAVNTRCPHCSKSYRQNNSFYKHLYEHHPQWGNVSTSLGLSKHQQVMLMQTADMLLSFRKPEEYAIHPFVRF